jgi:hypothetical protein
MTTRHELYEAFGPLLSEAIVLVLKDEINLLRADNGWAERTNAQLLTAVEAKLQALSKLDWMD